MGSSSSDSIKAIFLRKEICSINFDFSKVSFTQRQIPMYYSPVCRCTNSRRNFLARLACVKHAASVHSEPESNSPSQKLFFRGSFRTYFSVDKFFKFLAISKNLISLNFLLISQRILSKEL